MIEEKKRAIASVFDSVASQYETNKFFDISAQKIIELINGKDYKSLLDVATGTGLIAIQAAQKYPNLQVEAIDISNKMLNQARKKSAELGLKNIRFKHKDAEKIRYKDSTFDIITCGYALFFFPNLEDVLKRIYRTLKVGGQFIFSSFTKEAFSPYTELFVNLLNEYGIEMPKMSNTQLQTPEEIKNLCQSVGVKGVNIKHSEIRYEITMDGWWSLLNSAGYKGLLTQVGSERITEFKRKHYQQLSKKTKTGKILLIADSLYGIVIK
jgi:ubiquinone/menaquinone biosynthesis C-methylase UbiE